MAIQVKDGQHVCARCSLRLEVLHCCLLQGQRLFLNQGANQSAELFHAAGFTPLSSGKLRSKRTISV
jgi:hypothetical protein